MPRRQGQNYTSSTPDPKMGKHSMSHVWTNSRESNDFMGFWDFKSVIREKESCLAMNYSVPLCQWWFACKIVKHYNNIYFNWGSFPVGINFSHSQIQTSDLVSAPGPSFENTIFKIEFSHWPQSLCLLFCNDHPRCIIVNHEDTGLVCSPPSDPDPMNFGIRPVAWCLLTLVPVHRQF